MKKIVFGITSLTLGGAERVLIDICNKFVEKYDITIFTLYAHGELEQELDARVNIISYYDKKFSEYTNIECKRNVLNVLFNRKKIYRKYIENKYDVEISFLEGPITRVFSTKGKNKKIAWIHNDINKVFGKSLKAKLKNKIDKKIYSKYDHLIFVSKNNLDSFIKEYPKNKVKKEVIFNYVFKDRIIQLAKESFNMKLNKDKLNILQISRLVEQKGIDRLIKVHKKLIQQGLEHYIYIIGEGPLEYELKNKIKELKLEKTFILLGSKENPYKYIENMDCLVLFSKFEGYGIVIDEAKILNKYIVITETAAKEALLDYETNSKIVENNEDGVEAGLRYIIENKEKIVNKNNNYIYENNKILEKIEKVINEKE